MHDSGRGGGFLNLLGNTSVAMYVFNPINIPANYSLLFRLRVKSSLIGDNLLRGISGGERKRVTIAEMSVTHAPLLLLTRYSNVYWAPLAEEKLQRKKWIVHYVFKYFIVTCYSFFLYIICTPCTKCNCNLYVGSGLACSDRPSTHAAHRRTCAGNDDYSHPISGLCLVYPLCPCTVGKYWTDRWGFFFFFFLKSGGIFLQSLNG